MVLNRVLVLTDGSSDAEYRATGLLDALNFQFSIELRVLRLSIKEWKWWLCQVPYPALQVAKKVSKQFIFSDKNTLENVQEFNDGATLVVSCGRATIPTTIELKMTYPKKVFTVYLGEPYTHAKLFDAVVVAKHEVQITNGRKMPSNTILTEGIINRASHRLLRESRSHCQRQFCHVTPPLLVLSIGGPTWDCFYDANTVFELISSVCQKAMAKNWISTAVVVISNRTPKKLIEKLKLQNWLKLWTGDFLCALAWADFIAATADNLRACSETASSGKPLMVISEELCQGNLVRFFTLLGAKGVAKPFSHQTFEEFPNGWSYPAVHTSIQAANQVAERIASRSKLLNKWYRK